MIKTTAAIALALATQGVLGGNLPNKEHNKPSKYVDWRKFKATGVNLGGWLVQESNLDPTWWSSIADNATDEWTLCNNLGPSTCGPLLEARYSSFYTRSDIDTLAAAGVTLLRIPTTYAAWIDVPGSYLHHGNQTTYLKALTTYAIETYNMHIILDLHSLPGGVNGLDIGEAGGHRSWFNNATALSQSYAAVDAVLSFINTSQHPESFTLEPMNEPGDNPNLASIGSPAFLSESGVEDVVTYYRGVIAHARKVNPDIPIMLQTSFRSASYWAQFFDPRAPEHQNLVFDVHQYFFASFNSLSETLVDELCSIFPGLAVAGPGANIPVYLGEWSIQTVGSNEFEYRERNLQAGLWAADKFLHGSAYWSAKHLGTTAVDGEGVLSDYWNFETFVELGYVNVTKGAAYCASG